MNLRTCTFGLVLLCATLSAPHALAEDWGAAYSFQAISEGDSLRFVLTPKPGFYVNTAYPTKLTLESSQVALASRTLTKKQASFEPAGHPGKAKKATLRVGAEGDGLVKVRYKISICTLTGCSPPLKGSLNVKHTGPVPAKPPPKRRPKPAARSKPVTSAQRRSPQTPPHSGPSEPHALEYGCDQPARPGTPRVGP